MTWDRAVKYPQSAESLRSGTAFNARVEVYDEAKSLSKDVLPVGRTRIAYFSTNVTHTGDGTAVCGPIARLFLAPHSWQS